MKSAEFMLAALSKDMPGFDYTPINTRLKKEVGLLRLIYAGIGMSGEAGEILDTLKKSMMYGKELNKENLKEECGDLLWYMAVMLSELGISFEDVMQYNIDKLAKRYPNGFTESDALARKDKI